MHGIPDDVPREYGEVIARIDTDAALKHWRRTRTSGPARAGTTDVCSPKRPRKPSANTHSNKQARRLPKNPLAPASHTQRASGPLSHFACGVLPIAGSVRGASREIRE